MIIYKNTTGILAQIKETPFKLEKHIQTLFESNLESITSLQLVKSEFTIKNSRFDTLAFDKENKAFVIIEYKKDRNYSVIDQGVSYLNLMLEYKADFIIEYNESCKTNLKRNDVEWSQSKVIFVSPSFTDFQKQSSNFKDLPIELWEIKQLENDLIIINPIKKSQSAPSIKQVQSQGVSDFSKVTEEIKVYTEEDHLNGKSDEIKELYEAFKVGILNLSSDIEVEPKKWYIAFKRGSNIADIYPMKNGIKLGINLKSGQLDDPKQLMRDVSTLKGHQLNGDYELNITDSANLEYIMSLIKQTI